MNKALFEVKQSIPQKLLKDKYIVPPFSVFNTHQPYWRERLRQWRDLNLCVANGRAESLVWDNSRVNKNIITLKGHNGTSVFNPVVCEIIYKWFMTKNSTRVFDPFAGGITRGAIAAILGKDYCGFDVNDEQIQSNLEEYSKIQQRYQISGSVQWRLADSSASEYESKVDLVFTCPPYYNLERYSKLENDLSNAQSYEQFLEKYQKVIKHCYNCLNEDCFNVWVVSDVRDKETTEYYGLVADTIKIHQKAGFKFYNEIILYNDTGNLAVVSGDYLDKARKVGRQHQNILVFYKGDIKHIKDKFGPVYEEA